MIIAPRVELEVVIVIIGHGLGIAMPVGAASVVVGVPCWRIGSDPSFLTAWLLDAAEVEGVIGHVVHVVGEEEDGAASLTEALRFMDLAFEGEVDDVRLHAFVAQGGCDSPRAVLLFAHEFNA